MKKNEIILARIISTASASALALLILTVGIRSDYFLRIANQINGSTGSTEGADLFHYYYYAGFQLIYEGLFAVTVISLIIGIASILLRFKNCQKVCTISAVSAILTGVVLLLGKLCESSVGVHRWIANIYMGNTGAETIVVMEYLPKVPVWTILFLVVSVLLFVLIRVTNFKKIKLYQKNSRDGMNMLLAGIYGSLFLGIVRKYLTLRLMDWTDDASRIGETYVREYFIEERWLLALPIVIYTIMAVLFTIGLHQHVNQRLHMLMSIGIPTIIAGIIAGYYMVKPANVFGRLTLDERICDVTEAAMTAYLIQLITAVGFIAVLVYTSYLELDRRTMMTAMVVHACASLVLMGVITIPAGICGTYIGSAIADVAGVGWLVLVIHKVIKKPVEQSVVE